MERVVRRRWKVDFVGRVVDDDDDDLSSWAVGRGGCSEALVVRCRSRRDEAAADEVEA